jgi:hypothetical protein
MEDKDKIIKKRGKEVVDIVDSLSKIKDADNIKELEKRLKAARARNKKAEDKQITKLIDKVNEVSYSRKIKEIFKITNDKNLISKIIKMQIEKNKESVDFLEKLKEHLLNNEIEIVYELLGMEYSEVEKSEKDESEDKKDTSDENLEKKEENITDNNYNYLEEE